MNKNRTGISAARRNAESLLNQSMTRDSSLKHEQQREYEAMVLKTAKLRELRLAKEAADKKLEATAAPSKRSKPQRAKPRRSKQT
jgi:hypothetical protein